MKSPQQLPKSEGEGSVHEASWVEFQKVGLLWWVNQALHLFGWCLVLEYDTDETFHRAYPARTSFRGFPGPTQTEGYRALTHHLKDEHMRLYGDVERDHWFEKKS